MLLTVSGPPGSGKSTTAELLADAFDLDHVSGGDIFRDLADERGYTPSSSINSPRKTTRSTAISTGGSREIAVDADDLVLESRLAGWLAGDQADFRFWLDAPARVRGERIAEREEKDPVRATEETKAREASEAQRYEEYYGIDIRDLTIYDLSVNTARWEPDAVLDMLVTAVERYDAAGDEGKALVDLETDF